MHYALPVVWVVLYFVWPYAFYDEGQMASGIVVYTTVLLGLTFIMRYIRHRYAYNTLLVINVLLALPCMCIACVVLFFIVCSMICELVMLF